MQPTPANLKRWRELSHQNPCLMYAVRSGDGSPHRISDFLSSEELHELELYKCVYRPLGIEYQVALSLPAPAPLVLGLALNREARDFTDDEVRALDTLRPHLVQAYRSAQLLTERNRALASVACRRTTSRVVSGTTSRVGCRRGDHGMGSPPVTRVSRSLSR